MVDDTIRLADALEQKPFWFSPEERRLVVAALRENEELRLLLADERAAHRVCAEMRDAAEVIRAGTVPSDDIRWAVNVLLEKIATEFEAGATYDIWRSDAAALVRSHKHDLSSPDNDRDFRRRLNKARGHFGTATTQTQIPQEHREASISAVREFLDSLDPARQFPSGS